MQRFTSFAVAGPGDSSSVLISTILQYKQTLDPSISLRILTRSTTKPKAGQADWEAQGATIHPVLDRPDLLRDTLDGVQVVVSTIGILTPFDQVPLADAAREQGVELFLPFEFGADAQDYVGPGVYGKKKAFRDWLNGEGGWSSRWIGYHTGWYTEPIIGGFVGFDVLEVNKPARVKIWGDGEAKFSTTSNRSIGEFLAQVLTHQSRTKLLSLASRSDTRDNKLRLESARTSFNELLGLIQPLCRVEIEVVRVSSKELKQLALENPEDFVLDMVYTYDQGLGIIGPDVGGNWKEWAVDASWKPRDLKEMLIEKLEKAGRYTV